MKLEQIINLKLNNFEVIPPDIVEKEKEAEKKTTDITMNNFADYPWEDCIADQIKAYGDEEIAKKVCGKIKAENA